MMTNTTEQEAAPESRILAWHFINSDMTTQHDSSVIVKPGETLSVTGHIECCDNGLHGSIRLIDAFTEYSNGRTMLCRVEIWGDVDHDSDKIAGRYRKCLWAVDIERVLHEFACQAAEMALLAERAAGREPDPRCWIAIETKRKWLAGTATSAELEAARAAAWSAREAARLAAHEAACAAAWAACAADGAACAAWAAREAARLAAHEAAWSAHEAARLAAHEAAWSAHEAAWAAAWSALNETFEKLVMNYRDAVVQETQPA